jgi:hypothetical protein
VQDQGVMYHFLANKSIQPPAQIAHGDGGDQQLHQQHRCRARPQETDGLASGDGICTVSDALHLGRTTPQRRIGEAMRDDQHHIGNVAGERRLDFLYCCL